MRIIRTKKGEWHFRLNEMEFIALMFAIVVFLVLIYAVIVYFSL